jgi:quercetin dioxygenase-like cupin family protein
MSAPDASAQAAEDSGPRFRIFRAADAADLDERHMPVENVTPVDQAGMAEAFAAGGMEGAMARMLFADAASGMSICYLWFKPGFILPRHSHDADCAYYVVSGELQLGTQALRAGDGFFLPARHDYQYAAGPEGVEVLEFRNVATFNLRLSGNTEAAWRRMSAAAAANLDLWRKLTPPPAAARILAAEAAQ